ncbi:putative glycoside hydrolase family 16 protein [Botrytis cinerea BcDW1]|uniref:Putative glycoside hydrolase family 16 protein n=1 Tax=Botryotinia fuckeliana (strain BcDW1) TaxID=1290391 RepID=M7TSE8_BOTF1|nr:putative glycoside hydrolase family 16 protein [Botrytis cinerea BcDW1]
MHTLSILSLLSTAAFSVHAQSSSTPTIASSDDCSCGYYDIVTGNLFTESLITYFNETDTLSDDFILQSYENKYEKDYNSIFRQGSNPVNIKLLNSSSLASKKDDSTSQVVSRSLSSQHTSSNTTHGNIPKTASEEDGNSSMDNDPVSLFSPSARSSNSSLKLSVDPPNSDHLVTGGSIKTVRQDIQYGSARAYLRPSSQGVGGTSLSMMFRYNESESMEMNIMNTNQNSTAWVTSLIHSEFPNPSLGTNFSTFAEKNISLYNYNEFRLDWTKNEVHWYIGNVLVRSISKKNSSVPSTPSPFFIKHWSTGNPYSMQGPPISISDANIGWVRLFFNSSLMNSTHHADFNARCNLRVACSMENTTLRGSSSFPSAAVSPWEHHVAHGTLRWVAIWFSVGCMVSTLTALTNALLRLKLFKKAEENPQRSTEDDTSAISPPSPPYAYSRNASLTPAPSYRTRIESYNSGTSTLVSSFNFPTASHSGERGLSGIGSVDHIYSQVDHEWNTSGSSSGDNSDNAISINELPPILSPSVPNSPNSSRSEIDIKDKSKRVSGLDSNNAANTLDHITLDIESNAINQQYQKESQFRLDGKNITNTFPTSAFSTHESASPMETSQRVDHLAGLITIAAINVTVLHFCLTFVPAVIAPGAFAHYSAEIWINKTIVPFFLNQGALGLFFTTSARFLITPFLHDGDLSSISSKIVSRVFQIMLPVLIFALLEYFLILSGATYYLPFLPSITWSTWPYVIPFPHIGYLLNEVIALAYTIPNAVPLITFNYCTGVLWTIPVIIQGSWTTLLAILLITSIPTPKKRFPFYVFSLLINWYSLSWSSFFWVGILLTDLEVTYHMPRYLHKYPLIYYPLILTLTILALLALSADTFNQWLDYSIIAKETLIHPDPSTGLPATITHNSGYPGYPGYWVPHFNGLIFCTAIQCLASISPLVQSFLSAKHLMLLFPHVFSMYLFHGMIFWSLGSWVCLTLNNILPYWAVLIVTAVVCYTVLFLSLPMLSLIAGLFGKGLAGDIKRDSREEPLKGRPTLTPFGRDWLNRNGMIDGIPVVTVEASTEVNKVEKTDTERKGTDGVKIRVMECDEEVGGDSIASSADKVGRLGSADGEAEDQISKG